jgi:hypothetical protein
LKPPWPFIPALPSGAFWLFHGKVFDCQREDGLRTAQEEGNGIPRCSGLGAVKSDVRGRRSEVRAAEIRGWTVFKLEMNQKKYSIEKGKGSAE